MLLASVAAIAAALLAVTLTAMAIIANISTSYRRSLMMLEGGLQSALAPYQLVAAVCRALRRWRPWLAWPSAISRLLTG